MLRRMMRRAGDGRNRRIVVMRRVARHVEWEDGRMRRLVSAPGNPYAEVLRLPGARPFVLAGVVGRSAHLMTVLSIVFSVSATRGYALAGLVAAGYQIGYSAAGPFSARLCDRRGQSAILPWAALATGISRSLLLVALWQDAAGWELVVLAALSGGSMLSVGSLARSRWSHLLEGSRRLSAALSL
jgi:MFS family permease